MGLFDKLFGGKGNGEPEGTPDPAQIPDTPVPIAHQCGWYCIKAKQEQVLERISVTKLQPINWENGIATVGYEKEQVFVSPQLGEWVLAVGYAHLTEAHAPVHAQIVTGFDEVQFFRTDDVTETHEWLRFVGGKMIRAYGWSGVLGKVTMNIGEMTDEERALGFERFIKTDDDDWNKVDFPEEQNVAEIAAAWGIDPMFEAEQYGEGIGWLCQKGE